MAVRQEAKPRPLDEQDSSPQHDEIAPNQRPPLPLSAPPSRAPFLPSSIPPAPPCLSSLPPTLSSLPPPTLSSLPPPTLPSSIPPAPPTLPSLPPALPSSAPPRRPTFHSLTAEQLPTPGEHVEHRPRSASMEDVLRPAALEEPEPLASSSSSMLHTLAERAAPSEQLIYHRIGFDELQQLTVIASGSVGVVYSATWHGQPVAVKLLADLTQHAEFCREVAMLSLVTHPAVVGCYGANIDDEERSFLVLELCRLGSLRHVLDDDELYHRVFSIARRASASSSSSSPAADTDSAPSGVLKAAIALAEGLQYIHGCGFLHCDLKSLNILVTDQHALKYTDFGSSLEIAARPHAHDRGSLADNLLGSLPWYDPALLASTGRRYDQQADIYSLAMVFYEMLTRRVPFEDLGLSPAKLADYLLHGGAPTWPDRAHRFVELMQQCTAREPSRRPNLTQIVRQLTTQYHVVSMLEPAPLPSIDGNKKQVSDRLELLGFRIFPALVEHIIIVCSNRLALTTYALFQHLSVAVGDTLAAELPNFSLRRIARLGVIGRDKQSQILLPKLLELVERWRSPADPVGFGAEVELLLSWLTALFAEAVQRYFTDAEAADDWRLAWLQHGLGELKKASSVGWLSRSLVGLIERTIMQILARSPTILPQQPTEGVAVYWAQQAEEVTPHLCQEINTLMVGLRISLHVEQLTERMLAEPSPPPVK